MPYGKTKKMEKKSMMAEEAATAGVDNASASSLVEMKAKKKKKSAEMARADYDSGAPSKKKTPKKTEDKETAAAADIATPSLLPKKKTKKTNQEEGQIKEIPPAGGEVQSPSLYLVVRHAVECPAYSLYRIKQLPLVTPDPDHLPVPCRVKYLDSDHDMTFAAVSSPRRSWIVGVGGFLDRHRRQDGQGETIVFDCKTRLVANGPRPTTVKSDPVLFVVGEKIYALARMPTVWTQPDFPPWFEVLDVSDASCIGGQLTDCAWFPLPCPPLFPILNAEGMRIDSRPPIVKVESYAVVGDYIVFSIVVDPFTEREAGTVAFDTITDKWHFVDRQKNLPFIGEAVPYDDGIYLGKSKSKEENDLTAYNISRTKTKGTTPNLSIVEIPITIAMTNMTVTSGQFFSCLGNGVIWEVGCCTEGWICNEVDMDDICITVHRCVNAEEESKTQWPEKIVLSNNPAMYAFTVEEPIYPLVAPPLVAALRIHM